MQDPRSGVMDGWDGELLQAGFLQDVQEPGSEELDEWDG